MVLGRVYAVAAGLTAHLLGFHTIRGSTLHGTNFSIMHVRGTSVVCMVYLEWEAMESAMVGMKRSLIGAPIGRCRNANPSKVRWISKKHRMGFQRNALTAFLQSST